MSSTFDQNIGHATAYGYYRAGYTGSDPMTEEEFIEAMGEVGTAAETAVEAKIAAQAAQAAAEAAQTGAQTARSGAETARSGAETAQTGAAAARTAAEQAQAAAETAQGKAESAQDAAESAQAAAENAQTAAESAQTAAESAQTAAETAQGKAEDAQEAAETAAAGIEASAAQIEQNTEAITSLNGALRDVGEMKSLVPTTSPGYWTANGGVASPGATTQEVVTEWFAPSSLKVGCKLNYSTAHDIWVCVLYQSTSGTYTREVLVSGKTITDYETVITPPANTARLSFSYRTYGDCTFTVCGEFEPSVVPDDLERFKYIWPGVDVSSFELVDTIESSSSVRYNFSHVKLEGLYYLVAEMAEGYTYDVTCQTVANSYPYDTLSAIRYFHNTRANFYISPSASAGNKLYIYKVTEGAALSLLASKIGTIYPLSLPVNQFYQVMRLNSLDDASANTSRISSAVFNHYGRFKLKISDPTNYKAAIQTFSRYTRGKTNDSSWQTDGYLFNIAPEKCFVIVVCKTDGTSISVSEVPSGLITIEAVTFARITDPSISDINLINERIDAIPVTQLTALPPAVENNKLHTLTNLRNVSPIYDHLFVNDTTGAVIPHESLYHLRISHALGARIIEANTAATSDGVIIVNHLSGGKFGSYFHHVDGTTDISDISVSSVTWAWIVENVRYNSTIPKYRTRPARLEEFLEECNKQNMIPFVSSSAPGAIAMADKYMGHYNYICYGGSRAGYPYAIIYAWNVTNTTKAQILASCDAIGSPMIYGLGNPQSFTDSELLEIVEALHAKGYAIGTSYKDSDWPKYRAMGFDFNGSQTLVNRIEDGNLCNYSTIFGWDDFDLTGNPTNSDNVLTFSADGTITPKLTADTYPVSAFDLEIVFDGTITITSNSPTPTKTITSDGSASSVFTAPVLNNSPNVTIAAAAGTVVYDVYFKAKRCY